jgi:hypothetical protein
MARTIKLAGLAATVGIALMAAAPARAATVDLMCNPAFGNAFPVGWHVVVDLDGGTAKAWMSGHSPNRYEPQPADISDDHVQFQRTSRDSTLNFNLNRKTGRMTVGSRENGVDHAFACHLSAEQVAPLF